jgi:hypothetical protein
MPATCIQTTRLGEGLRREQLREQHWVYHGRAPETAEKRED